MRDLGCSEQSSKLFDEKMGRANTGCYSRPPALVQVPRTTSQFLSAAERGQVPRKAANRKNLAEGSGVGVCIFNPAVAVAGQWNIEALLGEISKARPQNG